MKFMFLQLASLTDLLQAAPSFQHEIEKVEGVVLKRIPPFAPHETEPYLAHLSGLPATLLRVRLVRSGMIARGGQNTQLLCDLYALE